MASIPLHCNICPKKPRFSDVSHLLTHIASKGHLSHYYKVKVRSAIDDASRQLIETYDHWYSDWNVEGLMSERMNMKDKKRPRTRASAASRASSIASSSNPSHRARQSQSRQTSTARSTPSYRPSPTVGALDPRLHDAMVKVEPISTPRLPLQPIDLNSRKMVSQAYGLGYGPPLPFFNKHNHIEYSGYVSRYDSPALDSHTESTNFAETIAQPVPAESITIGSTSPMKSPPSESTFDDLPEDNNETAKLKGVLWPGMSLFDSATPTARRKRNQKKDASILEQLEANSLDVEPTEMVWFADGILKKQKRISGMVDSSSSPPKSSPIKKQRVALPGVGLHQHYFGEAPLGRRSAPWMNDGAETGLMYSPFEERGANGGTKRKRGFEVWQDEDLADCEAERGPAFSRPSGFKYLTESLMFQGGSELNGDSDNNLNSIRLFEDPFGRRSTVMPADVRQNYALTQQSYSYASTPGDEEGHSSSLANHSLITGHTVLPQPLMKGPSARTSLGHATLRHPGWPQPQQLRYSAMAHSQQSSLTLTPHQQEHAVAPMYPSQAEWFPGLDGTDGVTPNHEHTHRLGAEYQSLFAINGLSGYQTGMNGSENQFDKGVNSSSGFFAINSHRKMNSIPGINQPVGFNVMPHGPVDGMQEVTKANGLNVPPDAKFNPHSTSREQLDRATFDAKAGFERRLSEETEDEDRTISEPCSQT